MWKYSYLKMAPLRGDDYKKSTASLIDDDWNHPYHLSMVQKMDYWPVEELYARWNKSEEILNEIYHIKFENLTTLYLTANNINSIEIISCIFMPQLERLALGMDLNKEEDNNIRSIRIIKKASLPRLQSLNLVNNPINDEKNLTDSNFFYLQSLEIDEQIFFSPLKSWKNFQCFSFLAKLETYDLKEISLERSRLMPKSLIRAMRNKWGEINVNIFNYT